jgi:hypothetical protein
MGKDKSVPTTKNVPSARYSAAQSPANGNGSAPPNNGGPPGIDGFDTPDPVTGSAIFREMWAINGPFEEPWMSQFNEEIWGAKRTWANDAGADKG